MAFDASSLGFLSMDWYNRSVAAQCGLLGSVGSLGVDWDGYVDRICGHIMPRLMISCKVDNSHFNRLNRRPAPAKLALT